jgi:hypothetical protein
MSTKMKAWIGGCAGVCLALIKLIEQQFLIGQTWEHRAGGYATAVSFVVIAALFASFIEETKAGKVFMQGLLAPSLLVAVLHQGGTEVLPTEQGAASADTARELSDLGASRDTPWNWSLIPSAYAQEAPPASEPERSEGTLAVRTISRSDLGIGFAEGALQLLGRGRPPTSFALVVGRTTDQEKAVKALHQLTEVLVEEKEQPQLFRAPGGGEIYVSLTKPTTLDGARRTKDLLQSHLLSLVGSDGLTEEDRQAINLVLNSQVIDLRTLAK